MKTVLAFLVLLFVLSCNNEKKKETNATGKLPVNANLFDKMIGIWQNENTNDFERWTAAEKGTYRADVYALKGSDTVWKEQATIYPENGYWVFENKVMGQNEGKSVKFNYMYLAVNSVKFSNPSHDFPTDINYTLKDEQTLHAFIIGRNEKGEKDTIPFNYKLFAKTSN